MPDSPRNWLKGLTWFRQKSASWGSLDEKTLSDAKQEEHAMQRVGRHSVPEAPGQIMEFSPVCFNGAVFFQDWKKNKLKTDQHFCKLGKIWIYIKQCTSFFFMDEHPQTAWALFSTIFAYLPRTWALRGTSWNLLWFVIPALLFRHGVPWTLTSGWPPRWITSFLNVW